MPNQYSIFILKTKTESCLVVNYLKKVSIAKTINSVNIFKLILLKIKS